MVWAYAPTSGVSDIPHKQGKGCCNDGTLTMSQTQCIFYVLQAIYVIFFSQPSYLIIVESPLPLFIVE